MIAGVTLDGVIQLINFLFFFIDYEFGDQFGMSGRQKENLSEMDPDDFDPK